MTNSYRKLLLTSSLVFMSLSGSAYSNAEILEDRFESSLIRAHVKSTPASNEIEIPGGNLSVPSKLGKVSVTYKSGEFYLVEGESKAFQVQRWNLSRELRGINGDQLQGFLKSGYLSVDKAEEEFSLKGKLRLRGGGYVGEKAGGDRGREVGRVAGGVAGGAAGGAIGYTIGSAIGGPVGGAVGGAIGAAVTYGGEALGNQSGPSRSSSSNAPSRSSTSSSSSSQSKKK